MDALISLGVTRRLGGQQRNRVFAHEEYRAMLNEGAELAMICAFVDRSFGFAGNLRSSVSNSPYLAR